MGYFKYCVVLLVVLRFAAADVAFLAPKEHQTFSPKNDKVSVKLQWIDNNANPKLDDIDKFKVGLCTGPNDNITQISTLKDDLVLKDMKVEGEVGKQNWQYNITFKSDVAEDGIYYLQVVSVYGEKYTIHYTSRFELEGMDHTNGTLDHGSMAPPPLPDTMSHEKSSSLDPKSFEIPYAQQTGSVRYAPMQPIPDKVTKRWSQDGSTARPTASPFVTYGSKPVVEYTITEPPSYTIYSGENAAKGISTDQKHYTRKVKAPTLVSTESST